MGSFYSLGRLERFRMNIFSLLAAVLTSLESWPSLGRFLSIGEPLAMIGNFLELG